MARREAISEIRPVLEDIDKTVDVIEKGLDAIEKGADIATEAVDKSVHSAIEDVREVVRVTRNPIVTASIIAAGVGVAAGVLGWHLAKRHYSKKYDAMLDREMESARKFFGRLNKVDESGSVLTPEEVVAKSGRQVQMEEAAEALKEYKEGPTQYNKVEPNEEAVEAVPVSSNVFLNGRPIVPEDFDLVEEVKNRDPETPYVISKDEFMENDEDFVQNTLTYYAGDDILADDQDDVVDNVEALVGTNNLARFGHGSGDKNVVYVRNESNGVDFEIAYSGGKYAEEVHGFLQHSDSPPRQLRKHKKHGGRE